MKNEKNEIDKNSDLGKSLIADMTVPELLGGQFKKISLATDLKIKEYIKICTTPYINNKYEDRWGQITYGKWFVEFAEGSVSKEFWAQLDAYQNLKFSNEKIILNTLSVIKKEMGLTNADKTQLKIWSGLIEKDKTFQSSVAEFNLVESSSFWKAKPDYLRNYALLGKPRFFVKTKWIEGRVKYLSLICKIKNLFVHEHD